MLDTDEILARLENAKIRNVEIAKALGLPDSRVPEIRRKDRKLTLDEGVKLVRAFRLESAHHVPPLPDAVYRLAVQHLAQGLGVEAGDPRLEELTKDLIAFAEFVSDPKVRKSLEAAEGFFQAMRLMKRPRVVGEAEQRSDPHRAQ